MKKTTFILMLLGITILIKAQIVKPHCYNELKILNGTYLCETYDDWVLVFEDEFIGTDINYDVWRNDFPWGRNLYCAGYPEFFTNGDNFDVINGKLKLIVDEETVNERIMDDWDDDEEMMCGDTFNGYNKRWFDYTSGMIYSKQKFIYGKFEIRCKIPTIKKLWPAFWLYGSCAQEIDVFEFMSDNSNPTAASKQITFTYHRNLDCDDDAKVQCSDEQNTGTDMSLAMHTYSVEWDEHKLTWRVDGNEVLVKYRWHTTLGQTMTRCGQIPFAYYSMDSMYPFDDEPMSIIASLGVKEDSPSTFPANMEIDYIRVYQRINSSSSVNICSNSDILGSTVAGQEIIIGGTTCSAITLDDGDYLDLVAKNEIILNSGLTIEAGAQFSMKLDN